MINEQLMKESYIKGIKLMQYVADGHCFKQAEEHFGLSNSGVDYLYRALKKVMKANDKPHLVAMLFREGLIK